MRRIVLFNTTCSDLLLIILDNLCGNMAINLLSSSAVNTHAMLDWRAALRCFICCALLHFVVRTLGGSEVRSKRGPCRACRCCSPRRAHLPQCPGVLNETIFEGHRNIVLVARAIFLAKLIEDVIICCLAPRQLSWGGESFTFLVVETDGGFYVFLRVDTIVDFRVFGLGKSLYVCFPLM